MMSLPPGGRPHWAPTPGYPSQGPLGTAALQAGQLLSTAIRKQWSPPPRALGRRWRVEWAEAGAARQRAQQQDLPGGRGRGSVVLRAGRPTGHPLIPSTPPLRAEAFFRATVLKRTLYPHQAPMRAQCLAHRCWVGIFRGIPRPWDVVHPGLKQACPLPSSSGLATPSHPPSRRSGGSRRDTAERVAGAGAPETSAV